MDSEERTEPQPVLAASPQHLQFGDYNTEKIFEVLPSAILTISNSGGDILAGRISPQVSWIHVDPPNFSCQTGETSEHRVTLTPETPHTWQDRLYSYDYLLLINSNGGSFFIGASYTAKGQPIKPAKNKTNVKWLAIPILAVFLVAVLTALLILVLPRDKKQPPVPEILYTHGAETVIAELTRTAAIRPLPRLTEQLLVHDFAEKEVSQPLEEISAMTLTPWIRTQYPNPEKFIKDYYREINNRNYERAWSMLTDKFQQSCCSVAGNDPFQVYKNWWNTIREVEVITAYLQAYDTNPAEVYITLRYHTQKGETSEVFNIYRLVTDPVKDDLKIDEVR